MTQFVSRAQRARLEALRVARSAEAFEWATRVGAQRDSPLDRSGGEARQGALVIPGETVVEGTVVTLD